MKSKKNIIFVSLAIAVVGVVLFTAALCVGDQFLSDKAVEWTKTVSAGLLTSSLVTFLISISEYKSEKLKGLERFYETNHSLTWNYWNLRDLHTEIPSDLLRSFLDEKMKEETGIIEYDDKPENDIKEYLWSIIPENSRAMYSNKEEYLSEELERTVVRDRKHIEEVIDQYLKLEDAIATLDLSSAYGGIDFIFDNGPVREDLLYKRIYNPQREAAKTIRELAFHLKLYNKAIDDGQTGNLPMIISLIEEAQTQFLDIREQEKGTAVYNTFAYEMDRQGYKLLKYTYGTKWHDEEPKEQDYLMRFYYK